MEQPNPWYRGTTHWIPWRFAISIEGDSQYSWNWQSLKQIWLDVRISSITIQVIFFFFFLNQYICNLTLFIKFQTRYNILVVLSSVELCKNLRYLNCIINIFLSIIFQQNNSILLRFIIIFFFFLHVKEISISYLSISSIIYISIKIINKSWDWLIMEEFISITCLKFLLLNIRICQRLERKINYYNIFSCSSLHLFESIEIPFNSNSQFVSSSLSIAFRFKSLLSLSLFFFKKKDSSKSKYINCNSFKFHFLFILFIYLWQFPSW